MRPCPQCGSPCPDEARACPSCGFMPLGQGLGQTFVGHWAPDAPLPAAPAPASPAPSAPAQPGRSLRSTMLGMPSLGPMTPAAAPAGPPEPTPSFSPGQTLAMNAPAAAHPAPAASSPSARAGGMKTIFGVALPGIAPLRAGLDAAPAPTPVNPAWSGAESLPPPPPPPGSAPGERAASPGQKRGRRIPVVAALFIVVSAALFTAAVVVLLLYRARGAIQANVRLGADGHEELVLTCARCEDGASVRLGGVAAKFLGGHATLRLNRELSVGDNPLKLELERRPGRTEPVDLTVPVEFRVRGETKDLDKNPPTLRILAQAVKGSAVVIDGKAVPLLADDSASLLVDVSRALSGPDASVRTLEQRVPYAITPPGGSPQRGEVLVRIGITPLALQAPGDSIIIDSPNFVLAGRTAKNGLVTVEGRPITVDAAGQFAQIMGVSSVGETTVVVRALAPDHAPRLVPVHVRRVESLSAEAEKLRKEATSTFAAVAQGSDSQRGLSVLFDGTVLETRVENFTTVFLLDVKSGCTAPPCLVRVSWGSKGAFVEGDAVSVYGTLSGSVDGPRPGTRILTITAGFVVKGRS